MRAERPVIHMEEQEIYKKSLTCLDVKAQETRKQVHEE
jgi:hypothetical protein